MTEVIKKVRKPRAKKSKKIKTIVLKDNDVLENKDYHNLEFDVLIHVKGDNVVIDNIFVLSPTKDFSRVIKVSGKNCIIKNCRFQDFAVNGPIIVVEHNEEPNNCIIQDNLFYGGLKTKENNGLECIRLGESKTSLSGEGRNIIYRNRFENMDREIEVISVKNSNNLIVNNEMVNCEGTFTLRHGKNNMVAYNMIDGKVKKQSGGIRVVDDNHSVIGNVLQNIQGDGLRCAISLMCGVPDSPLNRYLPIENCYLIKNVLFNCVNGIAFGMSKQEATIKPKNVYLQGTILDKCKYSFTQHKDHLGAEKILQAGNQEDVSGEKRLKYNQKPEEFDLDTLENMKIKIVEHTNAEIKRLMPIVEETKEEVKEDLVITDDEELPVPITEPRMVDIDVFMDKLTKKLKIISQMKRFEKLKEDMDKNLLEHKKLMEEMKNLMNP